MNKPDESVRFPPLRQAVQELAARIEKCALGKVEKEGQGEAEILRAALRLVCFHLACAQRQGEEFRGRNSTDLIRDALPELVEVRATLLRIQAGRFAQSKRINPDDPLYEIKHETEVSHFLSQKAAAAEIALENQRSRAN